MMRATSGILLEGTCPPSLLPAAGVAIVGVRRDTSGELGS